MTPDRAISLSDDDAASIGRIMVDASDKALLADKFCPGAVTTVHLFVDGLEFSVFVMVKREG
ncbi:MAG: hypothetical protein ACRCSX_02055 [Allorhizobium sp.]